MFGYQSLPITQQGDVNLICGTYVLPEVFPELGDIFAEGSVAIHIDLNAYEIAKNHRVDYGFVSDPKLTLAALGDAVEATITPAQREAARGRLERARRREGGARAEGDGAGSRLAGRRADADVPLHGGPARRRSPMARSSSMRRSRTARRSAATSSRDEPGAYFLTRGGSLGVGFPGAIGVKLAHPDKTVIGFSGDGGAMYTISGAVDGGAP